MVFPKVLQLAVAFLILFPGFSAESAGHKLLHDRFDPVITLAQSGRNPADMPPQQRPRPRLNVERIKPTETLSPKEAENRSLTLERLREMQDEIDAHRAAILAQAQQKMIQDLQWSTASALAEEADALFDPSERPVAAELRQACEGGDQTACAKLGVMYEKGTGTHPDIPLAFGFFLFACQAGDDLGCESFNTSQWLEILNDGYPGPYPDLPHFLRRCDEGHAQACRALGTLYRYGFRKDVEKDEARGIAYFSRGCIMGDERSCQIGRSKVVYTLEEDQSGCGRGDKVACYRLAQRYAGGRDVGRDRAEAVKLYGKTCDLGWGAGCKSLSRLYDAGEWVPQDGGKALALLERACELPPEIGDDCRMAGQRYEAGQGTPVNLDRALELYRAYCAQAPEKPRHCSDFWRLTAAQFDPLDPSADALFDSAEAAKARTDRDGCQGGEAVACMRLAKLYAAEPSGERRVIASGLYLTACRLGDGNGCFSAAAALRNHQSTDLYREACEAGVAQGCRAFSEDRSVDRKQRETVLEAACGDDVFHACTILAISWRKDDPEAVDLLEHACAKGEGDACTYLARSLDDNDGNDDIENLEPDLDRARELFIRGCELGSLFGCSQTVYRYQYGELFPRDLEKALVFARAACAISAHHCEDEQNIQLALEREALSNQHGHLGAVLTEHYAGVKPTHIGRVRRARLRCREGDLSGCLDLANYYEVSAYGDEGAVEIYATDRDWTKALYAHACDQGSGNGCYAYGSMFQHTDESDPEIAIDYFKRACQLNHPSACGELGSAFERGWDVNEDPSLARAYYSKACDLGWSYACGELSEVQDCLYHRGYQCYVLGRAFERGRDGHRKELALAVELYRIGCEDEDDDACRALRRLEE